MAEGGVLPLTIQAGLNVPLDSVKVKVDNGVIAGYSSSGHSDTSQHPTANANVNSTDTSRQGSLEAAAAATAAPTAAAAPPAAAATVQPVNGVGPADKPNAQSPAPVTAAAAAGSAAAAVHGSIPFLEQPAAKQEDAEVKQEPQHGGEGLPSAQVKQDAGTGADVAATPAKKVVGLPPLSPLPPPDPSEGPQVAAEYQHYMTRWQAGDTLAQRWHRLAESGKLEDIKADWEEWQQDLVLQQLQAQIQASNKGKKRKPEESEADPDAPRQTRNRRVPSALQDYQVEAPAAGPGAPGLPGVREDTPTGITRLVVKPAAAGGSQREAGSDDGDASYSEGQEQEPMQQRSRAAQQQQQQRRGPSRAYRPPPPVITQQQRQPPPPQQQQQMQQQAWGHWAQQQQQQAMMAGAGHGGVPNDLMQHLYKMGNQIGAALQQAGGPSTAAGQAGAAAGNSQANPAAAMAAAMEMCARMFGSDPTVFAQHMSALTQQQAHH